MATWTGATCTAVNATCTNGTGMKVERLQVLYLDPFDPGVCSYRLDLWGYPWRGDTPWMREERMTDADRKAAQIARARWKGGAKQKSKEVS